MSAQHHILITEDNQDLITIYSAKLQAEGYSVATASDGKEAFDRIREKARLHFTRHCYARNGWLGVPSPSKKEKALHGVPIVVMTNLGQDEDRAQCEKLGRVNSL